MNDRPTIFQVPFPMTRRRKWRFAGLLLGVLTITRFESGLASDPETAGITEGIRGELETQFRATVGLGFKAFACDFPHGWPASREILCRATDEEDDRFFYRLLREEGQDEPRVTMKQPVDQLNPEGLDALSRPVETFLAAFSRSDWQAVLASLAPAFVTELGVEGVRSILAPLKESVGAVSQWRARFYATPSEGLHQLDYALNTERGEAIGRFRLRFDGDGNPQIVSFLVTAEPGSPLHATMLEDTGRAVLGQFFDQPIEGVEGPFERLAYIGDQEEVDILLADGSSVRAQIEQHGTASDMDSNDYRFQLLDARTLIRLHLDSVGQSVASVDCPENVTPDGGALDCVVTDASGSTSTVRLMRRGGEHRLVDAQ